MNPERQVPPFSFNLPPSKTLADAEREHILSALRETGWVVGGPKGAAGCSPVRKGGARRTGWVVGGPKVQRPASHKTLCNIAL